MENKFDTAAENWDDKPGRLEMAGKFASKITDAISGKNYSSALEYGCGTANVSFFLKDNFEKIVLADSSKGMLEAVRKKINNIGVTNLIPVFMDLENENVDDKFDVIYTLMAMHHVKDIEKVIAKFGRMVTNNGVIIIGDLEKEDGDFHQYPENIEVHHGFEKNQLERLFNKNGMKEQYYHVFHELIREHTGIPKLYSLFALVAQKE